MNIERINALADLIEQQPQSLHDDQPGFNMNRFVHHCGTPSCIAGWAAWEALQRPANIQETWREGERYRDVEDEAREYLGIDAETAGRLFWGTDGIKLEPITKEQAARVLRHLAQTGEVDWSIVEAEILALEGDL